MTSTNDGKDVKISQTSGQKGKKYYIDIYNSLDARLNGECALREHVQHLSEAWGRIHSICRHAQPASHPLLLSWLERHTARVLLQDEWRAPTSKDEHTAFTQALDAVVEEIEIAVSDRHGTRLPWERQLRARAEWFKSLLAQPWHHPVLRLLVDPNGEQPTDEDVLAWLKEERDTVFVTRLTTLILSKCDDLATSLATAVMDRARAGREIVPDIEQAQETKEKPLPVRKESPFESVLRTDAGFTDEVWAMLTDIELLLLRKGDRRSRGIELAKQTPLRGGYELVQRLLRRRDGARTPRDKRLWKGAAEVAELVAQVVIARCMVVPRCAGAARTALYCCARALAALPRAPAALRRTAVALAAPAASAHHLYWLARAMHAQRNTDDMKPFACELYVRAITFGMNELEKLKLKNDKEAETRAMEQTLAAWLTELGALLAASPLFHCECALTAFSLYPSAEMYERIKTAPTPPPVAKPQDLQEPAQPKQEELNTEFGSWATDSRAQTNLVKTSETLNIQPFQHRGHVLSTAIVTEGECLGLDVELCQDIVVLLSGPRVKTLSWDMDRALLLENCRMYMERRHGGTRALTSELKYLNLNPLDYQHLPEEEDGEDDIYYGIQKGYEHLVEFQEAQPEAIWEDSLWDDDPTETESCSSIETNQKTVRRKKKVKQRSVSSENESDPLSLVSEVNKSEKKKDRPHSKDRSKGRRRPKKEPTERKEKKERKKKEKDKSSDGKSSSLSGLIGIKVARVSDILQAAEKTNRIDSTKACVTDSDYDSQGKSSFASEINEPDIVYDGQFSMDEIKSPERTLDNTIKTCLNNSELSVGNREACPSKATKQTETSNSVDGKSSGLTLPAGRDSKEIKNRISKLIQFRRQKGTTSAISPLASPAISKLENGTINMSSLIGSKVVKPEPAPTEPVNNKEQCATLANEAINLSQNPNTGTRPPSLKKHFSDQTYIDSVKKSCSRTQPLKFDYSKRTPFSIQPGYSDLRVIPQPEPIVFENIDPLKKQKPQSSSLPNVSAFDSHQKSFQEFLMELQGSEKTENIPAKIPAKPRKPRVKKEIKPMSKVSPVVTSAMNNTETKPSQCAKPVIQQKKVENVPNTFARLSYHKKQGELKPKEINDSMDQNQALKHSISEELDKRIADLRHTKLVNLQNVVISRIDNTALDAKSKDSPHVVVEQIEQPIQFPVLTNMLNTNKTGFPMMASSRLDNLPTNITLEQPRIPTPATNTALSEKDQHDLLLLLRQQSLLNAPVSRQPDTNKILNNLRYANTSIVTSTASNKPTVTPTHSSAMHNTNSLIGTPVQYNHIKIPVITKVTKTTDQVQNNVLYESKPKEKAVATYPKIINSELNTVQPRPHSGLPSGKDMKIKSENTSESKQDWACVLDALRKHKTPSRGPNALDMFMKRDSFEKYETNRMAKPRPVKINTFETPLAKTVDGANLREAIPEQTPSVSFPIDKLIIQNPLNTPKKPNHNEVKKLNQTIISIGDTAKVTATKKLTFGLQKEDDPFISGIPNSDYDLIEELMDDDLRQEIGEMSSDEERYVSTINAVAKGYDTNIKIPLTKLISTMPTIENPQVIVDPHFILNIPKKCETNKIITDKTVPKSNIIVKGTNVTKTTNYGMTNVLKPKPQIISNVVIKGNNMPEVITPVRKPKTNKPKNIGTAATKKETKRMYVPNNKNITSNQVQKPNIDSNKTFMASALQPAKNNVIVGSDPHKPHSVIKPIVENQISSHLNKVVQNTYNAANTAPTVISFQSSAYTPAGASVLIGLPIVNALQTKVDLSSTNVAHCSASTQGDRMHNNNQIGLSKILNNPEIIVRTNIKKHVRKSSIHRLPTDVSAKLDNNVHSKDNLNKHSSTTMPVKQKTVLSQNVDLRNIINAPKPAEAFKSVLKTPEVIMRSELNMEKQSEPILSLPAVINAKSNNDVSLEAILNKSCERKVLSQLQEKEKSTCPDIELTNNLLSFEDDTKDQERLVKKRLAIINRETNHRCFDQVIPLSYAPIKIREDKPILNINSETNLNEFKVELETKRDVSIDKPTESKSCLVTAIPVVVNVRTSSTTGQSTKENKRVSSCRRTNSKPKNASVNTKAVFKKKKIRPKVAVTESTAIEDENETDVNKSNMRTDAGSIDKFKDAKGLKPRDKNEENNSGTSTATRTSKRIREQKIKKKTTAEVITEEKTDKASAENKLNNETHVTITERLIAVRQSDFLDIEDALTGALIQKAHTSPMTDSSLLEKSELEPKLNSTLIEQECKSETNVVIPPGIDNLKELDTDQFVSQNNTRLEADKRVVDPVETDIPKQFKDESVAVFEANNDKTILHQLSGKPQDVPNESENIYQDKPSDACQGTDVDKTIVSYLTSKLHIPSETQILPKAEQSDSIRVKNDDKTIVSHLTNKLEEVTSVTEKMCKGEPSDTQREKYSDETIAPQLSSELQRTQNVEKRFDVQGETNIVTTISPQIQTPNHEDDLEMICESEEPPKIRSLAKEKIIVAKKRFSTKPAFAGLCDDMSSVNKRAPVKKRVISDETESIVETVPACTPKLREIIGSTELKSKSSEVRSENTSTAIKTLNTGKMILANNTARSTGTNSTPAGKMSPDIPNFEKNLCVHADNPKSSETQMIPSITKAGPLVTVNTNEAGNTNNECNSDIPLYYKNSISIEELPLDDVNDPAKKSVRVKLPSGKTFKATVYGVVPVSFDSLFSDPALKNILLSGLNAKKRYTLNIQHLSNRSNQVVDTKINGVSVRNLPAKYVETVNLISDDEEDDYLQMFKTEFGNYFVRDVDKHTFTKHQNKFSQKCQLKLNRCQPQQQEPEECKLDTEEVLYPILEALDCPIPAKNNLVDAILPDTMNKTAMHANSTIVNPDVIEIDDSSNDSVIAGKSDSAPKINEFKNLLLKELGVEIICKNSSKSNLQPDENVLTCKAHRTTESLKELNAENMVKSEYASVDVDNLSKNDSTFEGTSKVNCLASHSNRLADNLSLTNTIAKVTKEKSENKNDYSHIIPHECFIKLYKCDNLLNKTRRDDADDNGVYIETHVIKDETVPIPELTRSGSYSILNVVEEEMEKSSVFDTYESQRSSPVTDILQVIDPHCTTEDRNSPVMQAFDLIESLYKSSEQIDTNQIEKLLSECSTESVSFHSDSFKTKQCFHFIHHNPQQFNRHQSEGFVDDIMDVSTDYESDHENEFEILSCYSDWFETKSFLHHIQNFNPQNIVIESLESIVDNIVDVSTDCESYQEKTFEILSCYSDYFQTKSSLQYMCFKLQQFETEQPESFVNDIMDVTTDCVMRQANEMEILSCYSEWFETKRFLHRIKNRKSQEIVEEPSESFPDDIMDVSSNCESDQEKIFDVEFVESHSCDSDWLLTKSIIYQLSLIKKLNTSKICEENINILTSSLETEITNIVVDLSTDSERDNSLSLLNDSLELSLAVNITESITCYSSWFESKHSLHHQSTIEFTTKIKSVDSEVLSTYTLVDENDVSTDCESDDGNSACLTKSDTAIFEVPSLKKIMATFFEDSHILCKIRRIQKTTHTIISPTHGLKRKFSDANKNVTTHATDLKTDTLTKNDAAAHCKKARVLLTELDRNNTVCAVTVDSFSTLEFNKINGTNECVKSFIDTVADGDKLNESTDKSDFKTKTNNTCNTELENSVSEMYSVVGMIASDINTVIHNNMSVIIDVPDDIIEEYIVKNDVTDALQIKVQGESNACKITSLQEVTAKDNGILSKVIHNSENIPDLKTDTLTKNDATADCKKARVLLTDLEHNNTVCEVTVDSVSTLESNKMNKTNEFVKSFIDTVAVVDKLTDSVDKNDFNTKTNSICISELENSDSEICGVVGMVACDIKTVIHNDLSGAIAVSEVDDTIEEYIVENVTDALQIKVQSESNACKISDKQEEAANDGGIPSNEIHNSENYLDVEIPVQQPRTLNNSCIVPEESNSYENTRSSEEAAANLETIDNVDNSIKSDEILKLKDPNIENSCVDVFPQEINIADSIMKFDDLKMKKQEPVENNRCTALLESHIPKYILIDIAEQIVDDHCVTVPSVEGLAVSEVDIVVNFDVKSDDLEITQEKLNKNSCKLNDKSLDISVNIPNDCGSAEKRNKIKVVPKKDLSIVDKVHITDNNISIAPKQSLDNIIPQEQIITTSAKTVVLEKDMITNEEEENSKNMYLISKGIVEIRDIESIEVISHEDIDSPAMLADDNDSKYVCSTEVIEEFNSPQYTQHDIEPSDVDESDISVTIEYDAVSAATLTSTQQSDYKVGLTDIDVSTEPQDQNESPEVAYENVLENDVSVLYKDDSGVVLKGVEYDTYYVFSLSKSSDISADGDLLNDSTDNILNSTEETDAVNTDSYYVNDLKVRKPERTYCKYSRKRKANMTDIDVNKKKLRVSPSEGKKRYRNGRNIDYPKFTVSSMNDSFYGKEYKRLLDYYTSIKFSYSVPFQKDIINVPELISKWPINESLRGNEIQKQEESETEISDFLFVDVETTAKPSDPMELTLAEEINAEYSENFSSSEINETNFKMGFGERSGRVIQNLVGGGGAITKFSAATLSDVKQSQPFLLSIDYDNFDSNHSSVKISDSTQDELNYIKRYITYIRVRENVRSFFKNRTPELSRKFNQSTKENIRSEKMDPSSFPFHLYFQNNIEPSPIETVVQVVQVGQLPVSAAAQNPMNCDPRVTQVSDDSPSQCSVDNSPNDDSPAIKTEYTELTTADLSIPLLQDCAQHIETFKIEPSESTNVSMADENIPIETELIKSEVKIELVEEPPEFKEEHSISPESTYMNNEAFIIDKHVNNMEYTYETNSTNSPIESDSKVHTLFGSPGNQNISEGYLPQKQNGSSEKRDQIAHAMNAAGINTMPEDTIASSRAHALVNMLSQKIRQSGVNTTQNSTTTYPKAINAMALQQALAQILPSSLNQTSATENNQQAANQVSSQLLHIVQGKNSSGNQITLVDNTQQSVISTPNATPVLHIVQSKSATATTNPNGNPTAQQNAFSGLSLVDTGLQQGGNQLLHIVNTGNQKNNAGQLLKRVNLLTNLTNVQGSNDQKMVQFVCKSADGKAIQLNPAHQRSMVLRLQPIESSNIQTTPPKSVDTQDLSPSPTTSNSASGKETTTSQQEIKSRSVYEENYAKFIQNSSTKSSSLLEKSTSLPKFNQAFGKPVYQAGNQKPNEIINNNSHLPPINTNTENMECQPTDNAINIDHISQIGSPPLLLRKPPAPTSQAQSSFVQQLKQTIAPMNIQTMHGGVIYTRQIPVNIGGGQTINLITVPSTELIDDSGQKSSEVKFVNQGEMEPSIIKIIPQGQVVPNLDGSVDENNHMNPTNENSQNAQPPQVLTQMRIKLPMLSKAPHMVSGARVVRPSFFHIQRNVIGGANQPVYQQLVLTAAPPIGQQTIRLPTAQTSRQIKVPSESQSSSESQMSSSTLEQLREFDMVLEQVKERSTVQPNANSTTTFKLHSTSTDTTDSSVSASATSTETTTQQVLYSIGGSQPLNVAYVNRKATITTPTTSTFVRSPDSSGIADSPSSSTHVQIPHTVTSETSSSETPVQHKAAKHGSKSKSRPKSSSHHSSSMKINTVPPKTSTQKPLEDEQTTQRILYILAEYKEQVENSPDKDKPAPRRRTNLPPGSSGSSKRKKSCSGSRRPGVRDMSPVNGEDSCRTMGSEDSSCGTSQGDCTENCLETHSPQDSPRKVVRKLTFEQETALTQPRPQPQRNVIVSDGQTITVARGTGGKPATAVLMPANYILPVSMVKGGQQIAIVTNRGPKLLTVSGGDGGTTNALLLQRLIGPAGFKPVLRPGVRHVRLPTAALQNLQAFNLAAATTVQAPDSTASPAPAPAEHVEIRSENSPWTDRESESAKPSDRASSPEGSEAWNLQSSADTHDYAYEETVRAENMDRTVLDAIPDRYSPEMEAQRIFDKMFDVDSKKSYITDSHDHSLRCGCDIDASDDDKAYHQVVQKKVGPSTQRQQRLAHVSAAALRHKYAILEHELRLQKSLSEECEDLGVDSPSASELFPEAELLFSSSPAHEPAAQAHTPQPLLPQSVIQPDMDDQIATDQLLPRAARQELDVSLGLGDVGLVTMRPRGGAVALDHEEFARAHPNTTFHSEPTDDVPAQPYTITGLKGRQITSTIFHSNRAPATVLVTAPQTTVISQATADGNPSNAVKYDIENMMHAIPGTHANNINFSSVLVKDDGLTRYDNILTDSRELHLSTTASAIVHSTGNATQVIRRVSYENKRENERFLIDEPNALIAGEDAKMTADDSRDATVGRMRGDVDDGTSSPERHAELFWESNSASERSESRRPIDFSSDSDKCCKSPSYDETNSTDSSGVGTHMRLDSVIIDARGIERSGSADGSSADDTHPPLRTYPPKRAFHPSERAFHPSEREMERSLTGKTRAGERSPDNSEVRRRASGRGVVKRGCHCCNGASAPPRPKKPRQRKPTVDFHTNN